MILEMFPETGTERMDRVRTLTAREQTKYYKNNQTKTERAQKEN